jgi:hypothetical protein
MSLNSTIKTLGKLERGDTLCSDLTVVDHSSWFSSIKRYYSGDNRKNTLEIIEQAIELLEAPCETGTVRTIDLQDLQKAKKGIQNLLYTYRNDTKMIERLSNSLKRLEHIIRDLKEHRDANVPSKSGVLDSEFEIESSQSCESEGEVSPKGNNSPVEEDNCLKEEDNSPLEGNNSSIEEDPLVEEDDCRRERNYSTAALEEEEISPIEGEDIQITLPSRSAPVDVPTTKARGADEINKRRADKFEAYIKKKERGGRSIVAENPLEPPTTDAVAEFRLITMGDVVEAISESCSSLDDPLSRFLSHTPTPSSSSPMTWYVETDARQYLKESYPW